MPTRGSHLICPEHGELEPFMKEKLSEVFALVLRLQDNIQPVADLSKWGMRDLKILPKFGDAVGNIQVADNVSILLQGFQDQDIVFMDGTRPVRLFLIFSEDQKMDPDFLDKFIDDSDGNMPGKVAGKQLDFNMIEISNWSAISHTMMNMLPPDTRPEGASGVYSVLDSGIKVKAAKGYPDSDDKGYTPAFELNDDNYKDEFMQLGRCVIGMFLLQLAMRKLRELTGQGSSRRASSIRHRAHRALKSHTE